MNAGRVRALLARLKTATKDADGVPDLGVTLLAMEERTSPATNEKARAELVRCVNDTLKGRGLEPVRMSDLKRLQKEGAACG